MELVFIRHGQPAWSVEGLSQPDPHLTPTGREQARCAAERLAAEEPPVTEILVSPAQRALETAAPLAELIGMEPLVVEDLVEIQMPDWRGHPEETVQRIFAESRDRSPDEWWDGLPGGESFRTFHNRVTAATLNLLAERGVVRDVEREHLWHVSRAGSRIAVVAHGGTNAVAIGTLLGVAPTPWEWERFILYHASLAKIRAIPLAGEHVFSLRTFNDREHLPKEHRTR